MIRIMYALLVSLLSLHGNITLYHLWCTLLLLSILYFLQQQEVHGQQGMFFVALDSSVTLWCL